MFWNKKKKLEQAALVGASAKLRAAQRMRNSTRMGANSDDAKGQAHSQMIPVVCVFILCVVLVMIVMESSFINTSGWHPTGINNLDKLLVGSDIHRFIADQDINRLIVIFIRSAFLFVMTGIIPILALMATRMAKMGKLNPLIAAWGAIIALPVIIFLMQEMILPLIGDLIGGF